MGKIYDKKCRICNGKGYNQNTEELEVEIPVGVDNDDKVRVSGKGEAGYKGSESGDLYLIIRISNHKQLVREQQNITSTVEIGYFDLLLGGVIKVETVWGQNEVKIPPLTDPSKELRIKNQGMPKLNNDKIKGDHYINIKVKMPNKLSTQDVKQLEEIRKRAR